MYKNYLVRQCYSQSTRYRHGGEWHYSAKTLGPLEFSSAENDQNADYVMLRIARNWKLTPPVIGELLYSLVPGICKGQRILTDRFGMPLFELAEYNI